MRKDTSIKHLISTIYKIIMPTKTEVKIAKEIKTFIKLFLLCSGISALVYITLYFYLKPPINPPVPLHIRVELAKPINGPVLYGVSDALTTDSKYDQGMPFKVILNDEINQYRNDKFKKELNGKSLNTSIVIFIILILGRYLLLVAKWVNKTSQIEE
jgi:hypothetical protein